MRWIASETHGDMKSIAEEIFRIEHNGNNEWKIQKKRAF